MKEFEFVPFSEKQRRLLNWWRPGLKTAENDFVIADGAMRSGKTIGCIAGFLLWSQESFSGEAFILAGKTMGALRKNVIQPMLQILKAWGWPCRYIRSGAESRLEIGENFYYLYSAGNETGKNALQGLTAAGCYADEAALFPESFLNQMIGRCSVPGARIWMNCNPGSPVHFVKTEWIDKRTEKNLIRIHFMMDDNPALSVKIKERYRSMYSGVFYRRFVLGEWCIADGLVYPMFNRERHILDEIPEDHKPQYGRKISYYVSVDYGTSNPTAAGLWSFNGITAVMIKEFYYDGRKNGRLDDLQLYERLDKWIGNMPVEFIIVDPSAASFITMIRRHARYIVKGADNDVLDGIRVMTTFLNTRRIFFLKECTNIQREFELYSWDEDKEDTVVKEADHCLDQARYFCYGVFRHYFIGLYT